MSFFDDITDDIIDEEFDSLTQSKLYGIYELTFVDTMDDLAEYIMNISNIPLTVKYILDTVKNEDVLNIYKTYSDLYPNSSDYTYYLDENNVYVCKYKTHGFHIEHFIKIVDDVPYLTIYLIYGNTSRSEYIILDNIPVDLCTSCYEDIIDDIKAKIIKSILPAKYGSNIIEKFQQEVYTLTTNNFKIWQISQKHIDIVNNLYSINDISTFISTNNMYDIIPVIISYTIKYNLDIYNRYKNNYIASNYLELFFMTNYIYNSILASGFYNHIIKEYKIFDYIKYVDFVATVKYYINITIK